MSISPRKYALMVAVLTSFLTPFVGSSINIALPSIGSEFTATAILLGWIPTAYLLALAVCLVPFGRIADIYGRKRIFTYGIILFTVSSFLATLSFSIDMLLVFRVLQGAGSAMIFGNLFAIIASIFPASDRGKALGITITGAFLGLFLGPVLGGFLTEYFGWRSIFFFNVPLGILATLAVTRVEGEWAEASGKSFDIIGSIILGFTLVTLMYGLSILPETMGFYLILGGVVGLILFYIIESRMESPVLDVGIFKNRSFTLYNLAAFISYCSAAPIVFILSLYLQYIKGLDPQWAGIVLSVQPVMMVIFSPLAGKISDIIEPRKVAAFGMVLNTIGCVLFAFLGAETSMMVIVIGLGLLGLGFANFSSPNTNAIMGSVESHLYGVASTTVTTMRVLGQMSGMGVVLLVLVLVLVLGSSTITPHIYPEFITSTRISFAIFAILSFLGVLASMAGGNKDKNQQ
ncbi:MFS transporter [Methanobacterium sp.]|uniref:MFS transporter n=1 Tax=Methanobacterium sp. TaxID=2164 RepID=UPI0025CDFCE3|nr:MFS transporter [Methanobacterium sp.]MBI5460469.1 MFS transporter [Methanobacterium sp.]